MKDYFIVDVREEGADGQSEGMGQIVGEAHGKDVPGSGVGDNLILNALGLCSLGPVLVVHQSI